MMGNMKEHKEPNVFVKAMFWVGLFGLANFLAVFAVFTPAQLRAGWAWLVGG
jgi:hypothetical protein